VLNPPTRDTDVLVVGGGAAGRRAALAANDRRARVLLVVKGPLVGGGVSEVAVGAAAVTGDGDPEDSFAAHLEDTVAGGRFLADQAVARRFACDAPARLLDLERLGVRFDRREDGRLRQEALPGHRHPRSVTVGMRTGAAIGAALLHALRRSSTISVLERATVVDLRVADGAVTGARVVDERNGEVVDVRAGAVVLATGGVHGLYGARAYPAPGLDGDGVALGLRAGAAAVDLEFVQFFPTALVWPPGLQRMVWVGELRYGCGAWLLNRHGERFMERHDPVHMELATRDVVAAAIAEEIAAGRGTPHGGVWMSIDHVPPETVDRFLDEVRSIGPLDDAELRRAGVDLRKDRLEVAPLEHFHMGGLRADEAGATDVRCLFAAGEVAGGLHGANRIENNALTETQVFGAVAGEHAADAAAGCCRLRGAPPAAPSGRRHGRNLDEVEHLVRNTIGGALGVRREAGSLSSAVDQLAELRAEAEALAGDRSSAAARRWWSVGGAALVGEAMARSALARTESRGAHVRIDHPHQDDSWLANLVVRFDGACLSQLVERVAAPHVPLPVTRGG